MIEYSFSPKRLNFVNECAPLSRRFNYIFRENPGPVCPPKGREISVNQRLSPALLPLIPLPLSFSLFLASFNPRGNCCAANCFSFYLSPPAFSIHITAATLSSTFNVRVTRKGVGRGEVRYLKTILPRNGTTRLAQTTGSSRFNVYFGKLIRECVYLRHSRRLLINSHFEPFRPFTFEFASNDTFLLFLFRNNDIQTRIRLESKKIESK